MDLFLNLVPTLVKVLELNPVKKVHVIFVNMFIRLKCWCPPGMEETGQFVIIAAVPEATLFI